MKLPLTHAQQMSESSSSETAGPSVSKARESLGDARGALVDLGNAAQKAAHAASFYFGGGSFESVCYPPTAVGRVCLCGHPSERHIPRGDRDCLVSGCGCGVFRERRLTGE